MRKYGKALAIGGGMAALVVVTSVGTATAGDLIGSKDIKPGGVHKVNLSHRLQARLDQAGVPGKNGTAGLANVTTGAGYTHTWAGDGGATLNTIVSKCGPGQVALGGGFSTWGGSDTNESGLPYDLGGDNKEIQVTVSAPYTGEQYDPTKYHGDIRPDRWVVKGYNNGHTDQIVRTWVVCADIPA
jgi:hypothetical protein